MIVGAGQWANTCYGNVRPGESYLECAWRRLCEELGIIIGRDESLTRLQEVMNLRAKSNVTKSLVIMSWTQSLQVAMTE